MTGWTRRSFMTAAATAGVGAALLPYGAALTREQAQAQAQPLGVSFDPTSFSLGVASGDPTAESVILQTRLATDPFSLDRPGGDIPDQVEVAWVVAADPRLRRVVATGTAPADVAMGHAVHVDVTGLEPGRHHWYQFSALGRRSRIGRTKTAGIAPLQRLRIAYVSYQSFPHGYYTAYQNLAREDVDVVFHLGDYMYEYGEGGYGTFRSSPPDTEVSSVESYRVRYAAYRGDPWLRLAHAMFPFVVTWDDHEIDNNWAGDTPEHTDGPGQDSPEAFARRRFNAYQAYYEHMPIRPTPEGNDPNDPAFEIHRRLVFGDLLDVSVLDTRQYRDTQPCENPERQRTVRPRALPRAGGSRPHDHGSLAAGLAVRQPGHLPDGVADGRPAGHHRPDPVGRTARRRALPGRGQRLRQRRPVGRLPGRASGADEPPRRQRDPRHLRDHGGHPLPLGVRPEGGLRRSRLTHRGHRVRRHVHHLTGVRAVRPRPRRDPPGPVLDRRVVVRPRPQPALPRRCPGGDAVRRLRGHHRLRRVDLLRRGEGGDAGLGRIWRYRPAQQTLELFYESTDESDLRQPDNMREQPGTGDLQYCEDTGGDNANKLVVQDVTGAVHTFGRDRTGSEFAGASWSPDGRRLFVNIQQAGLTVVIEGPFRAALAAQFQRSAMHLAPTGGHHRADGDQVARATHCARSVAVRVDSGVLGGPRGEAPHWGTAEKLMVVTECSTTGNVDATCADVA